MFHSIIIFKSVQVFTSFLIQICYLVYEIPNTIVKPKKSQAFCMFIEGRTFSMSETAIQQIEYFDDCQDKLVRVSPDSTLIEPGTPNEEDTMKIVLAPEGTGEYEYNMFPTKLVDLVEEKIEEVRHDGIEKHPGLRTPMELKLAATTAREYFENDKFWPFLLKEMNYIGSSVFS